MNIIDTTKERILAMRVAGTSIRDIADRLGLGERDVRDALAATIELITSKRA